MCVLCVRAMYIQRCRHALFWCLVCNTSTQLATQLTQRRIQVVRSNKVARKRLTELNGTPAMDLRHMNFFDVYIRILFWSRHSHSQTYKQTRNRIKHKSIIVDSVWICTLFMLRWGWVFLERTRILSGIQFTTHFIDFFVVETKWFVGSFIHVILTRQTCGQRLSRAAESKTPSARKLFFRANLLYDPNIKM